MANDIYILGLSAFYHDSAAVLLRNGKIAWAVQEERFTRIKHDAAFPHESIKFILENEGISLDDIEYIAFYDKPFLKFERLLETAIAFAPKGFLSFCQSMTVWIKEKLFMKSLLINELKKFSDGFDKKKLLFGHHHKSHAASAFFPSPFERAAVVVLDGVGEWSTATVSFGEGNSLVAEREIKFPHSLGLLYTAFTFYCGFKVNSGEYKLMGLAPYGEPIYADKIKQELIDIKDDGSFWVNQTYFSYCYGLKMIGPRFEELFGRPARKSDDKSLDKFYMDVAASIQAVTEEIVLKIVGHTAKRYEVENLCLAGGVALNCVANGKILESKFFKRVWVQPASGDAGGALGVALDLWHSYLQKPRLVETLDSMSGAYLGPEFEDEQIIEDLEKLGAVYHSKSDADLVNETAKALSDGAAVGWFQGRMEFGPRALGNRSILGDPRDPSTQSKLNLKIKFRESFRPFAPSVLREEYKNWFDLNCDSPYMLFVAGVCENHRIKQKPGPVDINQARSSVPAITHVDYSARVQTVSSDTNKRYHDLIKEFYRLTGCPMLVNTSFNVRGEPIVQSPEDAFRCFMGTNLDMLVIGNVMLKKPEQDPKLKTKYFDNFDLD